MWHLKYFINYKSTELNIDRLKKILTYIVRRKSTTTMKVLNVAEKNDAAKNIAGHLSNGNYRKREGLSVYNKIYEFNARVWNQDCQMIMTSVSGHLLNYKFTGAYGKWYGCHPLSLFDAPVVKDCQEDSSFKIKKTIEREIKNCSNLIIWTDCDREGENIGFEIIQVCQAIKPSIRIYRAKFSEITKTSINNALQCLSTPNKAVSDAVDVRSELDLRIGAAFTRFQTLRLQKVFPRTLANMLISYGSCQFPTLGFVVERFLAIERFQPEPYWKIKVIDTRDDITVEFRWARIRLFEQLPCQVLFEMCQENPDATVLKVTTKPKSKWRPLPLDTIELEKQASRKLRINAKETMRIAEKLYTQGVISYPRTETNIFPKELRLEPSVTQQVNSSAWGQFAQRVLNDGISPRQGKKSDQAHPPIYPTKYIDTLQGAEAKVYEFIVRHFLACLSKNAEGYETVVDIDIANEKFVANGLQIIAKNYLDVYIYEKWSDKEIHRYQEGETFRPIINMSQEETSPPNLLTEADLIALMDKHGIGTDATHAEHIDTIKSRQYVGLTDGQHFIPGKLGIGLVMGYDNMGFPMSKPNLRADLENDLKLICNGQQDPSIALQNQIRKYRDVFKIAIERANLIDNALADYLDERPITIEDTPLDNQIEEVSIFKCPKCNSNMTLKSKRQGDGKYIGCMGYPTCNNAVWFPSTVEEITVLNDICDQCSGNMRKMKFQLTNNAFPIFGKTYTACIGGCDPIFNDMLNIKRDCIKKTVQTNDSGYNSISTLSNQNRSQVQNNSDQQIVTDRSTVTSQRNYRHRSDDNVNTSSRFVQNQNPEFMYDNRSSNNSNSSNKLKKTSNDQFNVNNSVTWGNIDNDAVIMCQCNENAIQLTVKKEGPNKGRLFYKCAKPQGAGCDFFMWASDQNQENNFQFSSQPSTSNNTTNWAGPSTSTSSNNCFCNQPAKQFTVHKDGPNKGRLFYKCPKGKNDSCNYFKWADEDENGQTSNDRNAGTSYTLPNNNKKRSGKSNTTSKKPRTSGKRKCGICGVEGHTRKTCPENAMD